MMSRPAAKPLSRALLHAHVVSSLVAVCIVSTALMAAGLLQLRSIANRNLELVAKSMAFSVEAAVVFRDVAATQATVAEIASAEDVENVVVADEHGQLLIAWSRHRADSSRLLRWIASHRLLDGTVRMPVRSNGKQVGEVQVRGTPDSLFGFLVTGFLWILVCISASLAMTAYMMRRTLRSIMRPLRLLTEVTRRVRTRRSFGERVPQADITELNDLANDFNSLLGELERWEASVQDEHRALAHKAAHDGLTGLPNRTTFENRLWQTIQRAQVEKSCFAVLFIDSNGFKSINDRYGHAAGDRVLKEIARRTSSQLNAGDLVARLGGDEFAVLLDPVPDKAGAERIAAAISASMAAPVALEDQRLIATSVSVGIALYPHDATDMAALLRYADAAMYANKAGRNGVAASSSDPKA